MTVINPNSISGITSITLPSGDGNVLTIHTNDGTERFRIDSSGNVKIGTAATISPDGDLFVTGVTTAGGHFAGSGANLTSLPAAQITGTLPAISAANLTNVPAANITGTLPAISAANLTNIPAANVTGTLPALTAANLTNIPAANIVGVCTSGLTKTGGFGKLLQIVNTHVTATSSLSMNGNEFTNISIINTSITPSSTSSKILVSMYTMGEGTDNDSNFITRVEREISGGGSTRLGGVDSGSRLGCFQAVTEGHDSGNTATTTTYIQFSNYLDSPNTTSTCTYKLYIRNASNRTWYINRTKDDTDNASGERGHSFCTLMEVQS